MAIRWSIWESTRAPWSALPPWIIMPSWVPEISHPMALKYFTITSIRLDSFTFSSAASLMTVVPSAQAAITLITGSSSISVGMISPSIVMPCNELDFTKISAVGSPSLRILNKVISPPMAIATLRMPSLVGLTPTFFMSISESGTMRPAAIK